tara:strand:- start:754 stop:1455 length:702 start_codon:yes stop_codon:yes gene_type:complete
MEDNCGNILEEGYSHIDVRELEDENEFEERNIMPLKFETFAIDRCCYKKYPMQNFDTVFNYVQSMPVSQNEKKLILFRIQRIFTKVTCLQKIYKYCYFYSRVFIVIASILAPTLTSINTNQKSSAYKFLWWVIWNLQISISLLTSISTFFKWDRNYFLYSEFKDKIEEEVWHYLESTHNYNITDCSMNKKDFDSIHVKNIPIFLEKLEDLYTNLCLKDAEIKLSSLHETKKSH